MPPEAVCNEEGLSLVELLVGMVVSMIVLFLAYSLFTSSTGAAQTITNRATNTANARLALDSLEANLRFADYVAVSGSGTATTLAVRNDQSTTNQPACALWSLTSQPANPARNQPPTSWGLVETISGTATVVMAGTTTATGSTAPFAMPLPTLVEIDLGVNDEAPIRLNTNDTVSVHDVVSPDNLHTSLSGTGTC